MLLVLHIVFALSSIPLMLASVVNEWTQHFNIGKLLPGLSAISFIGLLSTGTFLVVSEHLKLIGPCLEGLLYLALLSGLYFVSLKLPKRSSNK